MGKTKTYVLDTTVLIEDPDVMYKLGGATIVIPLERNIERNIGGHNMGSVARDYFSQTSLYQAIAAPACRTKSY